jgi:hypothetical protein
MNTGQTVLQATAERWVNLTGSDGKTKARLNLDTGELVIRDRGTYHKWPLSALLTGISTQGPDTREVLQST